MRAKILISTFIFFLSIELSCGSDESCKRDCSKAVRNNNVILEPLTDITESKVICSSTDPVSIKRVARFKAYTKDGSDTKVPRGYVMITPRLTDGVGGGWISTEYDQEEHNEEGLRGIVTKSSDFCSNSCGVVEIEYTLKCPGSSYAGNSAEPVIEVSAGTSVATSKMKIEQQ